MFLCALIQKKMQTGERNKGLTAVVVDDNKIEMPKLSDQLFTCDDWYDGLYQKKDKKKGWLARTKADRFDQIINTGFAIKSEHSSLVQVAEATAWVYRRHLELVTKPEEWTGEKTFYAELASVLDDARQTLGHTPNCAAREFYEKTCHPGWKL